MRATVGLTADEVAEIAKIKDSGTPEATALDSLTGITLGSKASAAQTVHALVAAGIQAIQDKAEEIGYQRLAVFLETDEESKAWQASRRARASRRLADAAERGAA